MPKYWGKQIFMHGRFPEVGQKQKTERKRLNDGNNNGQAAHGARKAARTNLLVIILMPLAGGPSHMKVMRRLTTSLFFVL